MISEGSCDTEDCSNDAENSALITALNFILKYNAIENYSITNSYIFYNNILNYNNISQFYMQACWAKEILSFP